MPALRLPPLHVAPALDTTLQPPRSAFCAPLAVMSVTPVVPRAMMQYLYADAEVAIDVPCMDVARTGVELPAEVTVVFPLKPTALLSNRGTLSVIETV